MKVIYQTEGRRIPRFQLLKFSLSYIILKKNFGLKQNSMFWEIMNIWKLYNDARHYCAQQTNTDN